MKNIDIENINDYLDNIRFHKSDYLNEEIISNIYKNNPRKLIELTFYLIHDKDYLKEEALKGFLDDFIDAFNIVTNSSNLIEIERSTKTLAILFESFLRIIAFYKGYYNNEIWNGNEFTKGIVGTSVGGLCLGLLENTTIATREKRKQVKLPEKLFNYRSNNYQQQLADFVNIELRRPAAHRAGRIDSTKIIEYSQKIILLYFVAINDNFDVLSKLFLKEYKYLNKIVENSDYKNLDNVYVELFGKDFSDVEVHGGRISDLSKLINDIESYEINEFENSEEIDYEEDTYSSFNEDNINSTLNIIELSQSKISFTLIGEPGAGKSTTLLKILYQNSKSILEGKDVKIPIYVAAKEFSTTNNFMKMLQRNFDEEWTIEQLKLGNYIIMIDGLNEITSDIKNQAINNLDELIKDYSQCSFILSDRKLNYRKYFNFPVYEIKPLENNQIKDFVLKYGKSNSKIIWTNLNKNKQLMELASNPLMLKMILSISKAGDIPTNKGKLYELFIIAIFEREKRKSYQISYELKIDVLSYVCYCLKNNGQISCNKYIFKELMKEALNKLKSTIDLEELFNNLLDNYIIKLSDTSEISFIHESYLDYFVSYSLFKHYKINGEFNIKSSIDYFEEPILMLIGLFEDSYSVNDIIDKIMGLKINTKKLKPKYLIDINSSDLVDNIALISKIANNYRNSHPDLYSKIERLLQNNLTIWKYLLFEKGRDVLNSNELFKALSNLNSENIFRLIFCSPSWVHLWLCDHNELFSNQNLIENKNFKISIITKDEIYQKINKSLVNNLNDVVYIFKQIDNSITEYGLTFPSIQTRLFELKRILIKKASYKYLKEYFVFSNYKDHVVLCKLIENNFDDIYLYDFKSHNIEQNYRVISKLINLYHNDTNARNIVIDEISSYRYSNKTIIYILDFLLIHGHLNDILKVISNSTIKSLKKESAFLNLLRQLDWDSLPLNIRLLFKNNLNSYKILHKNNNEVRFHCRNILDSKDQSLFEIDDIVENCTKVISVKKSVDIIIVNGENLFNLNDQIGFSGDITKISEYLYINYNNFDNIKLSIIAIRKSQNGNIIIEIDPFQLPIKDNLDLLKGSNLIYKDKIVAIDYFEQKNYIVEIHGETSNLNFVDDSLILENIYGDKLSINKIIKYNFHPSIVYEAPNFYNYIINELSNDNSILINFLLKNSLINYYLIENELIADFGIVINNKRELKSCNVYFPKSNKFIKFGFQSNIEKGNIVLINDKFRVYKIFESDSIRRQLNVKKGLIIRSTENNSGFIQSDEKRLHKDYYFSYSSCEFEPQIGDFVEFIPIPNSNEKYSGKWVAYNIKAL